jgi:GLPGLI family protein
MQSRFSILFFFVLLLKFSIAQDSLQVKHDSLQQAKPLNNLPRKEINGDITVSYSAELKSNKSNTGIGETYNGGIKTVFVSGDKVRVRLISLMRTQSIFLFPPDKIKRTAAVTKESGKNKYKYYLSEDEWKQYNSKYDSITCQLTYDSAVILNYPCRKAIISLKDGRSIGVYYTDSIKRKNFAQAEPVFSCIPGLVLQYEYRYKKGKIIYTATSISEEKIDPLVFRIPVKGVATRKFSMKPVSEQGTQLPAEEEEDAGDDKEEDN